MRYIGRQPVKVAEFEAALAMIKDVHERPRGHWNDKELQLKWVRPELPEIPMHVAGYGPKALAVAGRVGDGVIIQLADPEIIRGSWDRPPRRRGGRTRPGGAEVHRRRAGHVTDDLADARDQVRWFPAMVSNHVQGPDRPLRRRRSSSVPKALTDYVQAREVLRLQRPLARRRGARRVRHRRDLRPLLRDRQHRAVAAKLRELEAVGVDQFNIYLMTHAQEETLQTYGDEIIPQFSGRVTA